ncbi:MAG: OmpA family protein [Gemmatimonadota bacterium]
MHNPILKHMRALAAFLPALVIVQPLAAQREGSWELSAGGGVMILDRDLLAYLATGNATNRFTSSTDPGRVAPAVALRLGYNFGNHFGFSLGTSWATGSGVHYLTPLAALTYTVNLNANTSPFLTAGMQFTRISGENGRLTHPTWGAHAGAGVRSMLSEKVALRLEGRYGPEHYAELPGHKTAYTGIVTLGLSVFMGGPPADADADGVPDKNDKCPNTPAGSPVDRSGCPPRPCPVCSTGVAAAQPTPPPPPPMMTQPLPRCEHGVAPMGAEVDGNGCLVLKGTLVLEQVHFEFDKSTLTPTATPILDRVAESMLAHPNAYFEIAGHTDSVGTFAYNVALSQRRAAAVRDYLIGRGVAAERMTAVGYGEGLPIAPNATVEGRALNRRGVELRIKKP